MRCLHCDRYLGLFNSRKNLFCTEQHEALYREAAQRRLENPYTASAGTLETSTAAAVTESARDNDLTRLLQATEADSTVKVETVVEVSAGTMSTAAAGLVTVAPAVPSARVHPENTAVSTPAPAPPPADLALATSPAAAPEEVDRRSEPRVQAGAIVQVATLRHPERETSRTLVDTSDGGIQFTADADYPVGEFLVAELQDKLALAEVKYSRASGDKYVIGAECIQTAPKNHLPPASTRLDQAEVLIKALCDRVQSGFSDAAYAGQDAAVADPRKRALERVARLLEFWQGAKASSLPRPERTDSTSEPTGNAEQAAVPSSTSQTQAEPKSSSSALRTFAAVASGLMLAALLIVCFLQFRRHVTEAAPTNSGSHAVPSAKSVVSATSTPKEIKPQQPSPAKAAAKNTPQVELTPKTEQASRPLSAASGTHHAQIKGLEKTWVGATADGHKVFGEMIPRGSFKELDYSKFAFLHVGNAAGVEIRIDGQSVPMGNERRLRLVELTTSGFRFVRWSNDDPPQP